MSSKSSGHFSLMQRRIDGRALLLRSHSQQRNHMGRAHNKLPYLISCLAIQFSPYFWVRQYSSTNLLRFMAVLVDVMSSARLSRHCRQPFSVSILLLPSLPFPVKYLLSRIQPFVGLTSLIFASTWGIH